MSGEQDQFQDLLNAARDGCARSKSSLLEQFESYLTLISESRLDQRLRTKIGVSDIVQQTYEKAIRNLDDFAGDSEGQLRAWLRAIAVNEINGCRRYYKAGKRNLSDEFRLNNGSESTDFAPQLEDDDDTPGTRFVKDEMASEVMAALGRLSADQQLVIRLRNWEQLKFHEIGERMERTEDSARKLWQRAIIQLESEYRNSSPE